LLAEQGIVVSTSRLVVQATTYPVNGITSVSSFSIPGKFRLPVWLIVVCGLVAFPLGFLLFLWKTQDQHVVRMTTAGGQVDAMVSSDRLFIGRVLAALNQAIVQRG
jgi:hypothetical protein